MATHKSIAYQGKSGANSHIACAERFADLTPLPCPTFEDAFAAIQDGTADLGVIPIENSIAGRVADIHSLLPASGLHIVGETFLPIHFQLLGVKGARVSPDLRSVHSHVHALGQCRKIIRRLGLKPVVAGDTAGAAREVARWGDPTRAALATRPQRCPGWTLWVQFLADHVEDERTTPPASSSSPKRRPWADAGRTGPVVTTFVFRVRNVPAALYKALGGFATNGVNMTKLESYMVEGEFSATQFLADVDGHPEDPSLRHRALEELQFFPREVRSSAFIRPIRSGRNRKARAPRRADRAAIIETNEAISRPGECGPFRSASAPSSRSLRRLPAEGAFQPHLSSAPLGGPAVGKEPGHGGVERALRAVAQQHSARGRLVRPRPKTSSPTTGMAKFTISRGGT